jgi:hypothetical protein
VTVREKQSISGIITLRRILLPFNNVCERFTTVLYCGVVRIPVLTFSQYPLHNNHHPSPLRHDTMPDVPDLFGEATELIELDPSDEAQTQRVLIVRKISQGSDTWKMDSQSAQSQLRV